MLSHPVHRAARQEAAFEAEVERHYAWNFRWNLVYGLFGTTGLRLINAPTFVPDYMYRLGGTNTAVGLTLLVGGLCRFVGPLLGAVLVAHRPLVKPYSIAMGAMMRVAILGIAMAGLFLPVAWNLVAFVVFFGMLRFFDGIQSVTYNVVMGKIIPLLRRGGFIGLRDFLGGCTVALLSLPVGGLLERFPFPRNYGLIYLVALGLTSVGLACFAFTREPAAPWTRPPRGARHTLRSLPRILRSERNFALYCLCRALGSVALATSPFFILYVGQTVALSGSVLGRLTFLFFVAQTLSNLLWGRLADRSSFRAVHVIAGMAWSGAAILLLGFDHTGLVTAVAFIAVGAGHGGLRMAIVNMVFEFGLDADFAHRVAAANMIGEMVLAVSPLAAGLLADRVGYAPVFLGSLAFMACAQAVMAGWVRVPREGR